MRFIDAVSTYGPRGAVEVEGVDGVFGRFTPVPVWLVSVVVTLVSDGLLECPGVVSVPLEA